MEDAGQLELAAGAEDVTLFVTESLKVEGPDAVVNQTQKAPNLTIVYTGTEEVNLAGGSQAYFTLLAKDANINLLGPSGAITDFYGALVGKDVNIENSAFHYDVATAGVGLGADSATLTLLSRHR